ncbi:hypothetical protein HY374_00455 [Candidatus Berkelbacteria bacterium]|nr:hypothetical protein [Candidatus Berkelbacteria bacterium]
MEPKSGFPVHEYFFDRSAGLPGEDPDERLHPVGLLQLEEYIDATVEPNIALSLADNPVTETMGGLSGEEIRFLRLKLIDLDKVRTRMRPLLCDLRWKTRYESSDGPGHRELRQMERQILGGMVDLIHLPSTHIPLQRTLEYLELQPDRLVDRCLARGREEAQQVTERRLLPKNPEQVIDQRVGRLQTLLDHWLPKALKTAAPLSQADAREALLNAGADVTETYLDFSGTYSYGPVHEDQKPFLRRRFTAATDQVRGYLTALRTEGFTWMQAATVARVMTAGLSKREL